MQAIEHKTYNDYVTYNSKLGYQVIPESLYDNLKSHNEMFESFKTDMVSISKMEDNLNEDGSVNWNFVDSDMYMKWSVVLAGEDYTNFFNEAADFVEGFK